MPLAERKDLKAGFGGSDHSTSKKCEEIAKKHSVKVELCSAKDQSLHIVISGPEERVQEAKRQMVAELQTERDFKVTIPREQHKFLIGRAGTKLKDLQERTCTRIQVCL